MCFVLHIYLNFIVDDMFYFSIRKGNAQLATFSSNLSNHTSTVNLPTYTTYFVLNLFSPPNEDEGTLQQSIHLVKQHRLELTSFVKRFQRQRSLYSSSAKATEWRRRLLIRKTKLCTVATPEQFSVNSSSCRGTSRWGGNAPTSRKDHGRRFDYCLSFNDLNGVGRE